MNSMDYAEYLLRKIQKMNIRKDTTEDKAELRRLDGEILKVKQLLVRVAPRTDRVHTAALTPVRG